MGVEDIDPPVVIDGIITPELTNGLKEKRDRVNQLYAILIANPYNAPELVSDFKSELLGTIALLIENNIPIQPEGKERTADDVIRESLAELGGLLGAKGAVAVLKAKRAFDQGMEAEDIDEYDDGQIFWDPESQEFWYFDEETGEDVVCDKEGNPLE